MRVHGLCLSLIIIIQWLFMRLSVCVRVFESMRLIIIFRGTWMYQVEFFLHNTQKLWKWLPSLKLPTASSSYVLLYYGVHQCGMNSIVTEINRFWTWRIKSWDKMDNFWIHFFQAINFNVIRPFSWISD